MVDPDVVGLVEGDGITSPDVLGVDVGDGDVPVEVSICLESMALTSLENSLDNDVGNTADHADTTTLDDTAGALSNQRLVGVDSDTEQTGVVAKSMLVKIIDLFRCTAHCLLGNAGAGSIGLVVGAPVILVDSDLAGRSSTPGSTASGSGGTLGISEVEAEV